MAALLSFPDGCRDKRGSMLGQRNENPRLRTYMRLRAGIFLYVNFAWFLVFEGASSHEFAKQRGGWQSACRDGFEILQEFLEPVGLAVFGLVFGHLVEQLQGFIAQG